MAAAHQQITATDDPDCLPSTNTFLVQFDNMGFHKYKPSSLQKLTHENDSLNTPLTPDTTAVGDRVRHHTHGAGVVVKVPDPADLGAAGESPPTHFLLCTTLALEPAAVERELSNVGQ